MMVVGIVLVGILYLVVIAFTALHTGPRRADLAVVLGNEVTASGAPSKRLQARLDTAVSLYQGGFVRRVLVSGGIEQPGSRDEAAIMAAYLMAQGIPPSTILQDPNGIDTLATSRNTACLAGQSSVLAVTQWFHVPRTLIAMRRAGLRDVSAAWPDYVEWRDIYSFLREAVAIPAYILKPASAWSGGCGGPIL